MKRLLSILGATLCLLVWGCAPAMSGPGPMSGLPHSPPPSGMVRYDHVVIVIEENHDASQVIGSPYISSLAAAGISFSSMYGITHPSQPNYIALFSGSTRGVTDDSQHDLTAPNLAASLAAAGWSFATYSEGLPAAGSRVWSSGAYVRRHNPCASFTNAPDTVNLPFTSFPTNYASLPTVSFVVPNLNDDMHDGTVAQGDAWLQANMSGYASWAQSHNSLLIVTFDECSGSNPVATTPIATVFAGASLAPMTYTAPANLYSLVLMIDQMYGLATMGDEGAAPEIAGIWQ